MFREVRCCGDLVLVMDDEEVGAYLAFCPKFWSLHVWKGVPES